MTNGRRRIRRPVDDAMVALRPEKRTVRNLWYEQTQLFHDRYPDPEELLYLTLSGREGHDIDLLVERGLIQVTEVGGLAPASMAKLVAVESSKQAVTQLQRKFPGLKIVEGPFSMLVHGENPVRFPTGEHEDICRARVVNLDLNTILDAVVTDQELDWPILGWVRKLGEIHAAPPRKEWVLLLTLHGEIHWGEPTCRAVQAFLRENVHTIPAFAARIRELLGQEATAAICGLDAFRFEMLAAQSQQRVLMFFVPKKIVQLVHAQCWKIETIKNLRYGQVGHAPMVTWMMQFWWDADLANTPQDLYRRNVLGVTANLGAIEANGELAPEAV